jgi:outer membrane protein
VGQNPATWSPSRRCGDSGDVDEAFDVAPGDQCALRPRVQRAGVAQPGGAGARRPAPTVALRTQRGYAGPSIRRPSGLDRSFSASAVVSQPLFAGGVRRSRIRQATEQNNADLIAIEGARRAVLQDVSQAWNQLLAARSNIVSNEEQVRANRIAAEGVREEQAVGLRTTIEVLNAEQELRNSELLLVQARRDNYLAGALLLSAMGRLEARNLLEGIPTYEPDESFRRIRRSGSVPWEPIIEKLEASRSAATRSRGRQLKVKR